MNPESANLKNLIDIVEPEAISWWPLAVGWWVLLWGFLLFFGYLSCQKWRHWKRNAYRSVALNELGNTTEPSKILELMKRVALTVYPRSEVASLSGEKWLSWLTNTSGIKPSNNVIIWFQDQAYRSNHKTNTDDLKRFAENWIKLHSIHLETVEGSSSSPGMLTQEKS